ncbi:MAG: sporulation protein YunB [Eubacteriales bacterium]|nr:sporulation protein YunB [Eubacteriales bacterium]
MHFRRGHPKRRFCSLPPQGGGERRSARGFSLLLLLAALLLFLAGAAMFLKDISCQIAVSDASDIVTVQTNNAIAALMAEGEFQSGDFVSFEKNDSGEVTAIHSNMAKINLLSTQILERVVGATENRTLTVYIPAGNLTGVSLLMGRGPSVPVKIIMLTSSRVELGDSVITAGINQTKHQISLNVIVDIDILVPWGTESTQVVTEVMIADTLVVGKVPDTYLNVQK